MDTQKNKGGRPKKDPAEYLVQRSIRLTGEQWAKVDEAGLPALRKLLDRWKPKPPDGGAL